MDKELHHHLIDKIAVANAFFGAIALYPQLFSLLKNNVTENLSAISFWLILSNSIVWLWYGLHRKNTPLVISSLLNAVASALILLTIL